MRKPRTEHNTEYSTELWVQVPPRLSLQLQKRAADAAKESETIWHTHQGTSRVPLTRILHKARTTRAHTGGELNSIPKEWTDPTIRTKVALAFPDIYELGGSNLGLQVLYDRINRRPDLLAERVFCPWPDFEFYLRR